MLKLDHPAYSAEDTFAACISRVRAPALKARLVSATQSIIDASDAYEIAAEAQKLDQIVRDPLVNGTVTTAEMEAVYTDRMAQQNTPGRPIYDGIFAAAKGRCPLCAHRAVTTLDHHLPKTHYPALAVAPLNLVPSCSDCNKAKLARVPHSPEDVSIHPYFDDVDGERWLFAEVLAVAPASIRFRVEPPAVWEALLAERVRRHFRGLNLSALYGSEAAEELPTFDICWPPYMQPGRPTKCAPILKSTRKVASQDDSTAGVGPPMKLGQRATGSATAVSQRSVSEPLRALSQACSCRPTNLRH